MSKIEIKSWFGEGLLTSAGKVDVTIQADAGEGVKYLVGDTRVGREDFLAIVTTFQALSLNEIAIRLRKDDDLGVAEMLRSA